MKSLAWIEAENAEIDRRIAGKRAASIRRLKRRLERVLPWDDSATRKKVNAAIDAWSAAEKSRTK